LLEESSLRLKSARLTSVAASSFSEQGNPYEKGYYGTPSGTLAGSQQNEGAVEHVRPSAGTPTLTTWAKNWASPTQNDWKETGLTENVPTNGYLGRQAPRTLLAGDDSPRRLNPRFVEWLMGFPIGWTLIGRKESELLGMLLFPEWQLTHSSILRENCGSAS